MKMRKTPDPEMRWLKKLLPIAQSHGHAVVHSELVFFLNPRHRGENFKWADFVDFCVRSAESSVWQSFSTRDWNKYKDQIMDAAKRSARYAASYAMETSGLLDSDAKTNPMTDSLPGASRQDVALARVQILEAALMLHSETMQRALDAAIIEASEREKTMKICVAALCAGEELSRFASGEEGVRAAAGLASEYAEFAAKCRAALDALRSARVNETNRWENDLVQFARLLDEIRANIEGTPAERDALYQSMDLSSAEVDSLFDRASRIWECAKSRASGEV